YAVTFRKKFYESVDELQRDLDAYLEFYNRERAHQGYRTRGRTPYQTFLDGLAVNHETEVTPEVAQQRISGHRVTAGPTSFRELPTLACGLPRWGCPPLSSPSSQRPHCPGSGPGYGLGRRRCLPPRTSQSESAAPGSRWRNISIPRRLLLGPSQDRLVLR